MPHAPGSQTVSNQVLSTSEAPVLSLVQGNIGSFLPTPPCITASHCMASSNRNFSLAVLENRSLKSRCQQGQAPCEGLGDDPSLPLPAFGGVCGFHWHVTHHSSLYLCLYMAFFPLGVALCVSVLFSCKGTVFGLGLTLRTPLNLNLFFKRLYLQM